MKKSVLCILSILLSVFIVSCGVPSEKTPANNPISSYETNSDYEASSSAADSSEDSSMNVDVFSKEESSKTSSVNIADLWDDSSAISSEDSAPISSNETNSSKDTTSSKTTASSSSEATHEETDNQPKKGNYVWVTAKGKKYHSNSSCSNMKNPSQITLEEAKASGRGACSKCY